MSTVTQTADFHSAAPTHPRHLSSLTDADLLDAWVNDRHRDSLATLIERYRVMVMSVCRRRCRSEADADDAFQAAFLHLARNAKSIRDPRRLPGWLHRVAQRAATATLKHSARETIAMVDTPADPDDPLDRLTVRHEAIVLDEELAALPEHYRAALVMHILDGRSLGQLADQFGVTVGSIRGRLQRGKQLLARRLRIRGIVPVLAYAAAQACTTTSAIAASASDTLIASIQDTSGPDQLPDPPIEPSLLNSLLQEGTRLMPSLYTTGALVMGSGLLSLLMLMGDGTAQEQNIIEIPASISTGIADHQAQFDSAKSSPPASKDKQTPTKPANEPTLAVSQPSPTKTEQMTQDALDQTVELPESIDLVDLPIAITQATGIPVLLDRRGIEFAEVELAKQAIKIPMQEAPLRSVLRTALEPLGLRAIVEKEGLLITADPSTLVHRDIGVSRWINVDENAERQTAQALAMAISVQAIEMPLEQALQQVSRDAGVPIYLDRRSLEEVGLTPDVPVTLELSDIRVENVLDLMLSELELTYTVRGETLSVMTEEAAESGLLSRIYWLEGTGFGSDDCDALIDCIQTSIDPDGWDLMGGMSTVSSWQSTNTRRPAIVISTTYTTHRRIEKLVAALRETHFGSDPAPISNTASRPAPKRNNRASNNGGGGGFGGGGTF